MPDGGTPVWRSEGGLFLPRDDRLRRPEDDPGAWYPVALADARERVVQAAVVLSEWTAAMGREERTNRIIRVRNAVAALAELEATTSREAGT